MYQIINCHHGFTNWISQYAGKNHITKGNGTTQNTKGQNINKPHTAIDEDYTIACIITMRAKHHALNCVDTFTCIGGKLKCHPQDLTMSSMGRLHEQINNDIAARLGTCNSIYESFQPMHPRLASILPNFPRRFKSHDMPLVHDRTLMYAQDTTAKCQIRPAATSIPNASVIHASQANPTPQARHIHPATRPLRAASCQSLCCYFRWHTSTACAQWPFTAYS